MLDDIEVQQEAQMQELKDCGMSKNEISKKLDEFEQDFTQTKKPKIVKEQELLISFDEKPKDQ